MMLAIFLVSLLAISAVSAEDNVTCDVVSECDSINLDDENTLAVDESGDDSISVSNDEQVIGVDDAAPVTQVSDDELFEQSSNENEIKTSNSDSEDILTGYGLNGGIIEAKLFNITVDGTSENNVVVIWTQIPLAMMDVNGRVDVLVNNELKNGTNATHGIFPNGEDCYSYSLNDLGISNYNNEYYIKVQYRDYDVIESNPQILCEGKLGLSFMDYLTVTDYNVNAAAVEYHLANDFNGTITAKLNGEDLGEISCDSWQYNDTHAGYQIGTLKLDPSKVRLTDNKVIIKAVDYVKGVEQKEIIFDCSPSLVSPGYFYYGEYGGHPSQFFSIGEEFKIGIEVPKEITGTLKVYTTDEDLNKDKLLASAEIVDGLAIATVSLNTEGDYWLYLEYATNKGDGSDDCYIEIVKNSNNVTLTVSPTEFIVGDSNVTVSLNSSSPGELYIYKDGFGQSFYESANNHTIEYLGVGTHIIRVTFEGADDYYSKQFTINVKPWTPSGDGNSSENTTTITPVSSKVTTVYGGKYTIATLKDSSGNAIAGVKVTVKFSNGKTATATTDKNGKIQVTITGLVPLKTYKATVTYAGNTKYAKSTKQVNVYVKKATPKIIAAQKTFKKSLKTKKYTVTLKDNNNKVMSKKNVKLTVRGKTYSANTNSKGQVTFKITNLNKKGTFNAAIKFAGNSYYNKVTKTVKIITK